MPEQPTQIDALAQVLWDYNHLEQPIKPADCIFVLGSHDLRVARRGAELFLQGYAPRIIFSGGFGRLTRITKKLLAENHITLRTAIVVQKPYMLRRAYAALRKQWPELEVMMTAPAITYQEYPDAFTSRGRLIHVLVGDTQRLRLYAERGLQIPQEIPDAVWDAYSELVKLGYNKHLVVT